jgi:hypothetical protein
MTEQVRDWCALQQGKGQFTRDPHVPSGAALRGHVFRLVNSPPARAVE